MNEELARCAQINFENLLQRNPRLALDPLYLLAKAQLDQALGGMSVEDKFALGVKRAEKGKYDQT